ncbi:MAG: hypothetical protein ACTSRE_15325 [Promethearchaeota archaeon]
MLEKIHDHLLDELRVNTKTDTIFILTSIILNFTGLGINSLFASNWASEGGIDNILMFSITGALIVIINAIVIFGLSKGKQTRARLLEGLISMYVDQKVDKYYSRENVGAYNTRYSLFTIVVLATGIVAMSIPFILMVM